LVDTTAIGGGWHLQEIAVAKERKWEFDRSGGGGIAEGAVSSAENRQELPARTQRLGTEDGDPSDVEMAGGGEGGERRRGIIDQETRCRE